MAAKPAGSHIVVTFQQRWGEGSENVQHPLTHDRLLPFGRHGQSY